MTIASLKQQNYSIRQIASLLQRSASTVSRELSRNSQLGTYTSVSAPQSCRQRRFQSRPARKLHPQSVLFGMVRTLLCSRWFANTCPKAPLSGYSQEQLDAIADEINNRPRKGLGVRSSLAVYRKLLLNSAQQSTFIH